MESDYHLHFLQYLRPDFDDDDVDHLWHGRVFPLIQTHDFPVNWIAVEDVNGIFIMSGSRYRVDPRPHHASQYEVNLGNIGSSRTVKIPYEAIIFAKITYNMSLNRPRRNAETPSQVENRYFIDQFVRKLPTKWRDLIVQHHLHLYDETSHQRPETRAFNVYQVLSNPRNIRLLNLLPSPEAYMPIECTLQEAKIDAQSIFEALSYVWGPQIGDKTIVLNGEMFPVGDNLEAALRHLRSRDETRTLWVDAICINQVDLQERADQVARMDCVYQNATRVIVWMGRESNTSIGVFNAMEAYNQIKDKETLFRTDELLRFPFDPEPICPWCEGYQHPEHPTDPNLHTHISEVTKYSEDQRTQQHLEEARKLSIDPHLYELTKLRGWESFVRFLRRPWWRRVWVLQEALLAKKITLQCGSRTADWQLLQGTIFAFLRIGRRIAVLHDGSRLRQGWAFGNMLAVMQGCLPFFLSQSSVLHNQSNKMSVSRLLALTCHFEATDPRDKIFGLVGLLPPTSPERLSFKPDYRISVKRLYIHVAKCFLEASKSLGVITARPLVPSNYEPTSWNKLPPRGAEMPSWAPDWKAPFLWTLSSIWVNEFSPLQTLRLYMPSQATEVPRSSTESANQRMLHNLELFNASLDQTSLFSFEFSAYDEILHTRGLSFDIVEEIGWCWDAIVDSLHVIDRTQRGGGGGQIPYIQQWKSIANLHRSGPYPFSDQSRDIAFWRTILLDRYRVRSGEGHGVRLFRIPPWLGEEGSTQEFEPGSVWRHFPPKSQEDETQVEQYIRSEVVDLWSFASFNLHCMSLRFFRTKQGAIGLGHPNVLPGDTIAVLLGSCVPLILRKFDEGNVLIGQSYVHGIMDGEVISREREQGRGRKKEDFELFSII